MSSSSHKCCALWKTAWAAAIFTCCDWRSYPAGSCNVKLAQWLAVCRCLQKHAACALNAMTCRRLVWLQNKYCIYMLRHWAQQAGICRSGWTVKRKLNENNERYAKHKLIHSRKSCSSRLYLAVVVSNQVCLCNKSSGLANLKAALRPHKLSLIQLQIRYDMSMPSLLKGKLVRVFKARLHWKKKQN